MENGNKNKDKSKSKVTIIILLLLLLLLLIVFTICFIMRDKGQKPGNISESIPQAIDQVPFNGGFNVQGDNEDTEPTEEERTEFPLYSDMSFTEGQYVPLVNLESNTVYIDYAIYYQDKIVYESGMISPGNAVPFYATEVFKEPGDYPVILYAYTYDINNPEVACIPLPFDLTITIEGEKEGGE